MGNSPLIWLNEPGGVTGPRQVRVPSKHVLAELEAAMPGLNAPTNDVSKSAEASDV
jgi:hypothetical protein